jgi:sugar-specific transcriptional regulator TrmB
MSKETSKDLRSHLFDAIERVKSLNDPNTDDNEKMSIEQAEAICNLAGRIIDSAKVEVVAMKLMADGQANIPKNELFITD